MKPLPKYFAAKLRIHCLKRHIDRRKVIFDHTFNIFLTHIRQCNIISLQKRKPGIIILEIQCFSHAWRHLIDKAEHTVIAAGTVIIHQAILEFDSKIFIVILLNFKFPILPPMQITENKKVFGLSAVGRKIQLSKPITAMM